MSKVDAERALEIYKTFSKQTDHVVQFLGVARQYENATRLEIPKLKHAPTSLTKSLEEYLNDPDFDLNRRQYLAQQDAKKSGRTGNSASKPFGNSKPAASKVAVGQTFPEPKPAQASPARPDTKGPAPDLIDFFESIEQNQQSTAQQFTQPQVQSFQQDAVFQQQDMQHSTSQVPQTASQPLRTQQMNGMFIAQNGNPFGQPQQQPTMDPSFTGAGFSGYTTQTQQPFSAQQPFLSNIPQDNTAAFAPQQLPFSTGQQQSTNPFRQSTMPQTTGLTTSSYTGASTIDPHSTPQSTNPFARSIPVQSTVQSQGSPFSSPPPVHSSQPPVQQYSVTQPLQPMPTGTNPFARDALPLHQPQNVSAPLMPNPTGSTNPFRQSAFVNQQTGQGWQASQGTMGGLEELDTIPVFPRPGQPLQTQQPQYQGWP